MLDILIEIFKLQYINEAEMLHRAIVNDRWPIGSAFLNLALLLSQEAESERKKIKNNIGLSDFAWHDIQVNQAERIYESRKPIQLEELFKPMYADGNIERKKIILYGGAGTGKSTVTQRIAYDWASTKPAEKKFKFPNATHPFKLVIWIKLRNLVNYINTNNGEDSADLTFVSFLINTLQPKLKYKYRNHLEKLNDILSALYENDEEVLYLCDGNDEIANLPQSHLARRIYENFLLAQPNLFVTSRPYYDLPLSNNIDKNSFRLIELLGFNFENSFNYLEQHFKDREKSVGYDYLKGLLQNDHNIRGLAHIPINMEILCALMTVKKNESCPKLAGSTRTNLYQEMVFFLLQRHSGRWLLEKSKNILLDKENIFKYFETSGLLSILGNLALKGLSERRLVFSADEVKAEVRAVLGHNQNEKQMFSQVFTTEFFRGWTWQSGAIEDNIDFIGQGEFLHLTLQEYIAAWFLVFQIRQSSSIFGSRAAQIIEHYKYHPLYSMTWLFVAGLLSSEENVLSKFVEYAAGSPYIIAGYSYDNFILRCLEEIRGGKFSFSKEWDSRAETIVLDLLTPKSSTRSYNLHNKIYLNTLTQCSWIVQKFEERFISTLKDSILCRIHAAKILGKIGAAAATPKIIKILKEILEKDDSEDAKIYAAEAIIKIDGSQSLVVDILVQNLNNQNLLDVCINTTSIFCHISSVDKISKAVMPLYSLLKHPNESLRINAALALGRFGRVAESVIPLLLNDLDDSRNWVTASAAHALGEFDAEIINVDVILKLMHKICDEEWDVRYRVAQALRGYGPKAAEAGNLLETFLVWLTDVKEHIRGTVAYLLGELGSYVKDQEKIKAALEKASNDPDPWTRSNALDALARLGKSPPIQRRSVQDIIKIFAYQQRKKIKIETTDSENKIMDEPDWSIISAIISKTCPDKDQKDQDVDMSLQSEVSTKVSVVAYWPVFEKTRLFQHVSYLKHTSEENKTRVIQDFLHLLIVFFCKNENRVRFDDIKLYYVFLYVTCNLDDVEGLQLPISVYTSDALYDALSEWNSRRENEAFLFWERLFLRDCFNYLKPTFVLRPLLPSGFNLNVITNNNELFRDPFMLQSSRAFKLLKFFEESKVNPAVFSMQFVVVKKLFLSGIAQEKNEDTKNISRGRHMKTIFDLVSEHEHEPLNASRFYSVEQGKEEHELMILIFESNSNEKIKYLLSDENKSYLTLELDGNNNHVGHMAALAKNQEILKILHRKNVNIYDGKNKWGLLPLHFSILLQDELSVRYMITTLGVGAKNYLVGRHKIEGLKDREGKEKDFALNFLEWAILFGNQEIIDYLFEYVDLTDQDGLQNIINGSGLGTLLHIAVRSNSMSLMRRLLEYGTLRTLINVENEQGITPLGLALLMGHLEIAEILINYPRTEINHTSVAQGWTLLHWMIWELRLEAVKFLMKYEVDTNRYSTGPIKEQPSTMIQRKIFELEQQIAKVTGEEKKVLSNQRARARFIQTAVTTPIMNNPYFNVVRSFKNPQERRYTSLVLNGGGAKGILFPYALECLEKQLLAQVEGSTDEVAEKILKYIQRVAGTSAGSIAALFISLGCDTKTLQDELVNLDVEKDILEGKALSPIPNAPAASTSTTTLRQIVENGRAFVDKIYEQLSVKIQQLGMLGNIALENGIISGDNFLAWVEKRIAAHLTVQKVFEQGKWDENITFKEWHKLVESHRDKGFKHLYIVVTQLNPEIRPLVLNTEFIKEDDWYANVPIADGIRASMSIPLVFSPYNPRKRDNDIPSSKWQRVVRTFVDGGLLLNYPLHEFDKAYYAEAGLRASSEWSLGRRTYINHNVLGLCLTPNVGDASKVESPKNIKDLLERMISLYYNNEMLSNFHDEDDTPRTIFLPCSEERDKIKKEITTLDFLKLKDKEYIELAKKWSKEGVDQFLKCPTLGESLKMKLKSM